MPITKNESIDGYETRGPDKTVVVRRVTEIVEDGVVIARKMQRIPIDAGETAESKGVTDPEAARIVSAIHTPEFVAEVRARRGNPNP